MKNSFDAFIYEQKQVITMRLWYRWHLGDICGKKKIERDEQREGDGERQREQDGKRQSEIERESIFERDSE